MTEETETIIFDGKVYNIPKVLADKWAVILEKDRIEHPWSPPINDKSI